MPAPRRGKPNQPEPSPNVFRSDTKPTDPSEVARIDVQDTRRLEPSAPRGRLAVRVPLDAPIGEPLPGLIALGIREAAEEPVTGEWRLSRAAGGPPPAAPAPPDLGLAENSALVLRRPGALDFLHHLIHSS